MLSRSGDRPSARRSRTHHSANCRRRDDGLTKVRIVLARDVREAQRVRLVREVGREVLERRQLLLARLAECAAVLTSYSASWAALPDFYITKSTLLPLLNEPFAAENVTKDARVNESQKYNG